MPADPSASYPPFRSGRTEWRVKYPRGDGNKPVWSQKRDSQRRQRYRDRNGYPAKASGGDPTFIGDRGYARGLRGWGNDRGPVYNDPLDPIGGTETVVVVSGGATLYALYLLAAIDALCLGACFEGDTPVVMADGTIKRIDQIQLGDWILSRNEQTGEIKAEQVLHVCLSTVQDTTTLVFSNGEKIKTTKNHPFNVPGKGFVAAKDIVPKMRCMLFSGDDLQVVRVEQKTAHAHRVYNLDVNDFHTYFVGKTGVWVRDVHAMNATAIHL